MKFLSPFQLVENLFHTLKKIVIVSVALPALSVHEKKFELKRNKQN